MIEQVETERLRARMVAFAAQLADEFPKQKLARAFIVTACDVSLADVGLMSTVWMTEQATNLLAGHWSQEGITMFIDTNR